MNAERFTILLIDVDGEWKKALATNNGLWSRREANRYSKKLTADKVRNIVVKTIESDAILSDLRQLVVCKHCGHLPQDIGTFGRVKFVCYSYISRDEATTSGCGNSYFDGRASKYSLWEAVQDWNASQK